MSPFLIERRRLLRSGVAVAGGLAIPGLLPGQAVASQQVDGAALTGALVGWLVVEPDGGGEVRIVQLDARSAAHLVAIETIAPATSVAGAARAANLVAVRTAATLWRVRAEDCTCGWGRIDHRPSGQSVPFSIWTDFT